MLFKIFFIHLKNSFIFLNIKLLKHKNNDVHGLGWIKSLSIY